ncbi:MAG: hypothetical protein D6681_14610, partial [Calditrichaeota bacterium]
MEAKFPNPNGEEKKDPDKPDKELEDLLGQIHEQSGESPRKAEKPPEDKEEIFKKPRGAEEEVEDVDALLERISEKEEQPAEALSIFERVVGVFVNPRRVFEYLRVRPDIWLPLILILLSSMASLYLTYDIVVDYQIESIQQMTILSEDQIQEQIDNIEAGRYGTRRYLSIFVFQPLQMVVGILLIALIYWFVGNVVLGGNARFKQLLSVYTHALLIFFIVGTIISVPVMIKLHTLKLHMFSLAGLLPEDMAKTALFRFLASFDIFTVWFLIVFGIGFATLYRFSFRKGFLGVFVPYLLWVLGVKVALGSFLSK